MASPGIQETEGIELTLNSEWEYLEVNLDPRQSYKCQLDIQGQQKWELVLLIDSCVKHCRHTAIFKRRKSEEPEEDVRIEDDVLSDDVPF